MTARAASDYSYSSPYDFLSPSQKSARNHLIDEPWCVNLSTTLCENL